MTACALEPMLVLSSVCGVTLERGTLAAHWRLGAWSAHPARGRHPELVSACAARRRLLLTLFRATLRYTPIVFT